MLRPATEADAAALCAIYNPYILETVITFDVEPVTVAQMAARIAGVQERGLPWLVYDDGAPAGYAYASQWQSRAAYRQSVETTVYLAAGQTGRGLGRALMEGLLDALRQADVHAVIAGIALPNPASVGLHERLSFEKIAHFCEVGWKFGQWIDVGYWELVV